MQAVRTFRLVASAYMIAIIAVACAMIATPPAEPGASAVVTQSPAELLYAEYCMDCHGTAGAGDGRLAYLLYPKPRDFTSGSFKIRSTPSGETPTDYDLAKTIADGMPGTAMPAFRFLNTEQINSLVTHVKQLGRFQDKEPVPITIPSPPTRSEKLVSVGRQLYVDLGCNQCHGAGGMGDGPSASLLKDDQGYPIQVRDFTRGTYLGGGSVEDIYLRFVTGMSGTPMPSYLEILQDVGESDQERQDMLWGLVYFVKSLETDESKVDRTIPPEDGSIISRKVESSLKGADLSNPRGEVWSAIPAADIPISRLWQKGDDNLDFVSVKSVHNNSHLAVMLEWVDATNEDAVYRIQDFQDAAAVQFSLSGKPGFHGMGSAANPVNIWLWKAEWQLRSENERAPDIELAYGNRASDSDVETYPSEIAELAYLPGRDVGNILSGAVIVSPVEDANAAGPETLSPQRAEAQDVLGSGEWTGEKWRVVFVRKMDVEGGDDIRLNTGESYPIAFAVWDGAQGDRNGQKMVSTWYNLVIQP